MVRTIHLSGLASLPRSLARLRVLLQDVKFPHPPLLCQATYCSLQPHGRTRISFFKRSPCMNSEHHQTTNRGKKPLYMDSELLRWVSWLNAFDADVNQGRHTRDAPFKGFPDYGPEERGCLQPRCNWRFFDGQPMHRTR